MTPGAIARALAIAFVLPLSGCVLVIGTSPSPFNEAQIIVIVRTHDSGVAIKGAGVAVLTAPRVRSWVAARRGTTADLR